MGIGGYTLAGAALGAMLAQLFVAGSESRLLLTAVVAVMAAIPGYLVGVARTPDNRSHDVP